MVTSVDLRRHPPLPATLKRCRPPPQGGRGRFVNSAASTGEARSDGAGAIAALQILSALPLPGGRASKAGLAVGGAACPDAPFHLRGQPAAEAGDLAAL